jgi:cob(I)alamin adenosyltransferase
MPRLTRIYTRSGDDGTTALGSGERVSKTSPRVAAYGTIDELNAQLGVVLAELCISETARAKTSGPAIEKRHVEALEELIDRLNKTLPPLKNFVLPGGSLAAAHLHVARTVCRRAERAVVTLAEKEPIGSHVLPYLNRLSDALFVMARYQNRQAGVDEPLWDSRA